MDPNRQSISSSVNAALDIRWFPPGQFDPTDRCVVSKRKEVVIPITAPQYSPAAPSPPAPQYLVSRNGGFDLFVAPHGIALGSRSLLQRIRYCLQLFLNGAHIIFH